MKSSIRFLVAIICALTLSACGNRDNNRENTSEGASGPEISFQAEIELLPIPTDPPSGGVEESEELVDDMPVEDQALDDVFE